MHIATSDVSKLTEPPPSFSNTQQKQPIPGHILAQSFKNPQNNPKYVSVASDSAQREIYNSMVKEAIEIKGGKNSSYVSKSTDILIAGENMGPSKLEKAEKFKVSIMNENEFLNLISKENSNEDSKQYQQGELF